MGRKKKEEKPFIPSLYQEKIFDFFLHGHGNTLIEATAGAGKTLTLCKLLEMIPEDKKVLFCAFNKEIVKELDKRVKNKDNVDVRTIHSLGGLILKKNTGREHTMPNESKYRNQIFYNLQNFSTTDIWSLPKKKRIQYKDNILKLVNYFRYNLVSGKKDALRIVDQYQIDILKDEIETAFSLLEWGKDNIEEIDYTDMVWLPIVNNYKPYGCQYDYIFCDECQDLSIMQRELILRCNRMGTRYVFCGDRNQAIYGFMGASPESFDTLKSLPNTTVLPLSISYRCAKNIVKYVNPFVPSMEAHSDNIDGVIEHFLPISTLEDGDMVVCRNNAPLIKLYSMLLHEGKKCFIRGKDIGVNLIDFLKIFDEEELNVNLNKDGLFVRLYESLFELRSSIMSRENLDADSAINTPKFVNRYDMIRTLEMLSEGIRTKAELIEKIKNVFSDKSKDGIALSTVHKAKGLEADRVFILCDSLMPSKSAKLPWEIQQEKNLKYVAYSRAKKYLGFLDETPFKDFAESSMKSILEIIEKRVVDVLDGKTFIMPMTSITANEIIKNRKTYEIPSKTNYIVGLRSASVTQPTNRSLSAMFARKLVKKS